MNVCTYSTSDVTFLCLSDSIIKLSTCYYLLDRIKEQFYNKYSTDQINKAIEHGLSFKSELKALMLEVNANQEIGKAKNIISNLSEVKDIAADNLS